MVRLIILLFRCFFGKPPKIGSQYVLKFDRERNVALGIHFENNRFMFYATTSPRKKDTKDKYYIITHKLVVVEIV